MIEDKNALELEIENIEDELEGKKLELENVRELIEKEKEFIGFDDEDEDQEDIEEEEEEEDLEDETDEEDEDDNLESLLDKEKELLDEILILQMKLVALNKQLNDIIAKEAVEKYTERED